MKRGLKLAAQAALLEPPLSPWTCPDEEGIETPAGAPITLRGRGGPWTCPDEEGIETASAPSLPVPVGPRPWTCPDEEGIETLHAHLLSRHRPIVRGHAPMKRGLKHGRVLETSHKHCQSVDMPR